MEKEKYVLKLPLKQMSLRKIAIGLWNGTDIINLIKQFRYQTQIDDFQTEEWHSLVEKKLKEKISLLVLPPAIEKELMHAIEPIGPEILKWKIHHQSLFPDVGDFLDQLCWTSVGTVDYRETAETLIKQERINIISRYQLACLYCLNDDIPLIWEKLSEDTKKCFYDEESPLQATQAELVVLWTHILKGDEAKLYYRINRDCGERTLYQYAFVYAAQSGNKAATQYFFRKLTFEERTRTLQEAAQRLVAEASAMCSISFDFPKEKFCDVLCFLLSQMDEEEQIKVFKKNAYTCLCCFLNWPWQDLFMKVAGLSWAFLSKEKYCSLIAILASGGSISGCYFPELFGELFLHAPSDYRGYIMDRHWESGFWFRYLFHSNSTESIKLVIRNADSSDKQRFIICENGLNLCRMLIDDRKWFLLELFIAECALSEEAKAKLKDVFTKSVFRFNGTQHERERFFHLINTANVEDCSKRHLEVMENEEHDKGLKKLIKVKRRRIF